MPPETGTANKLRENEAPAKIPPALPCSDCKTVMRTVYFVMNERPVCPGCRGGYKGQVERGAGPAAMMRAALYGTGAAAAGAIGLMLLLMIFGGFRIIASIGIAYIVAKAIGKATGDYGGRRYQILAVGLTYLAISIGALAPVIKAAYSIRNAKAPPVSESRTGPAGQEAEFRDAIREASLLDAEEEGADPAVVAALKDSLARADSIERLELTRETMRGSSMDASAASRLSGGVMQILLGALGLLVVLPILSSFTYGLYAGVLGIFALCFGMKRAWDMTTLVTDYQLSGPFRVGQGPIAATIGV